jgi:hypothetical protein
LSLQQLLHSICSKELLEALPIAVQCVAQALKLLHGDNAVVPALRAAAEHYHAQRAAPFDELAQLLAQVSIAAQAQVGGMPASQFLGSS